MRSKQGVIRAVLTLADALIDTSEIALSGHLGADDITRIRQKVFTG